MEKHERLVLFSSELGVGKDELWQIIEQEIGWETNEEPVPQS
jgi:GTP-binding protein